MKPTHLALSLLVIAAPCRAWDTNLSVARVSALSSAIDDPAWVDVASAAVRLAPQQLAMPGGGGAVKEVAVQALRTDTDLYLRLRWADATKNATLDVSNAFADAAAVQFPLDPAQLPSPFMGSKGKPVNIWRWSAAMDEPARHPVAYSDYHRPDAIDKTYRFPDHAEDLVAEGFGTLASRPEQPVEAHGSWQNGYWTLVFKRALAAPGGTPFRDGTLVPVAFAVWDGAAKERDGAKSFSVWQNLLLGISAPALPTDKIALGAHVFNRYGCSQCHGEAGKGGMPNPDAEVNPIPELDTVSVNFGKDEVKYMISHGRVANPKDPKGLRPRLSMNAWQNLMDKEELRDLVDYLYSLKGKPKKVAQKEGTQ